MKEEQRLELQRLSTGPLWGSQRSAELARRQNAPHKSPWHDLVPEVDSPNSTSTPRARSHATGQWLSIRRATQSQRLRIIAREPAFRTWELFHLLLELSRSSPHSDPEHSRDLAELAGAVLNRLSCDDVAEEVVADHRAQALMALAEAFRLAEDLEAADAALFQAQEATAQGSGDPFLDATALELQAMLRRDRGDLEKAARLLSHTAHIYSRQGNRHQEGRTLLRLAGAVGLLDPVRAVDLVRTAQRRIDLKIEPSLNLTAHHALAWFLCDARQVEEALEVFDRARPLYRQFPGSRAATQETWLAGRISARLGDLNDAVSALSATWHEFRIGRQKRALPLVSLDLIDLYLARGRERSARRLLATVLRLLGHWGARPWILSACEDLHRSLQATGPDLEAARRAVRETFLVLRRYWLTPPA